MNLGQPVPTEAKDGGGSSDNWTTGAISRAKLQPNDHHQQTNIQFFYSPDALPVAQPTVSKHWREKYHTPWTCLPQTHLGVFQLCLWHTNSSRLPWGGLPCLSSALWRQYPILPVKICSSNPQRQRTSQWPAVLQKCGQIKVKPKLQAVVHQNVSSLLSSACQPLERHVPQKGSSQTQRSYQIVSEIYLSNSFLVQAPSRFLILLFYDDNFWHKTFENFFKQGSNVLKIGHGTANPKTGHAYPQYYVCVCDTVTPNVNKKIRKILRKTWTGWHQSGEKLE